MAVHLESPYLTNHALWLKGNLHTHTTRSDGTAGPQEIIRLYGEKGYDFLALTDHDVLSDLNGLDPCGMVLLAGNEVSGGSPHVLDIGARTLIGPCNDHQELLDAIHARSGLAVLNHPNWEENYDHYPFELMARLRGYAGIEIFNGIVLDLAGSHLAWDKWDRLLSGGKKVWGFANDDAHKLEHAGRGWNVVQVTQRSAEAILEALRGGRFYASTGVTIQNISVEGSMLHVRAADAERMAVVGEFSKRLCVADGPELHFDASAVGGSYIRVECMGPGGDMAWTQPFFIKGGKYEQVQEFLREMGGREKSVLRVLRAEEAPKITGRMDDPLWQKAAKFDQFIQFQDGKPAPVGTEVRCILAQGALHFGMRCLEPLLEKVRVTEPGEGVWNTDSVEIFLDVEGEGKSCYHIVANASGGSAGACRGLRQAQNPQVRAIAGQFNEGEYRGWVVEVVVPTDQLNAPTTPGTRWGLHLCRNRRTVQGTYVWSWVGTSNHNREQYGALLF